MSSETRDQCDTRRHYAGAASHESYETALRSLKGDLAVEHASCVEGESNLTTDGLRRFDGIFFPGSPIQLHEESEETRLAIQFMDRVFEAGTPSFGSCAGLQIAAVAAGGRSAPRSHGLEAAFSRHVLPTDAGRNHPMLKGRPPVWTAPAMHSSVVTELPKGAVLLAHNADTRVEAAEIRHRNGVFWGVQYHPEINLAEIAASLRRQSSDLLEQGLAVDEAAVEAHARKLEALDQDPDRQDLAWQLGLEREVTDAGRRKLELKNFLDFLAERRRTS
ncbi:glutamine amidotransferase-related protein [Paracoccus sp. (in: a-proteobacteria)]|uniref:glutamine amidotransferase-related protein n=1 Tax=Paracoccus sp. TaxID=267 RepID=UPI00396C572A